MAEETQKKSDLVDLTIPRGASSDEPNLIISVNGKNYSIPNTHNCCDIAGIKIIFVQFSN